MSAVATQIVIYITEKRIYLKKCFFIHAKDTAMSTRLNRPLMPENSAIVVIRSAENIPAIAAAKTAHPSWEIVIYRFTFW